jgi:hypothetical protein
VGFAATENILGIFQHDPAMKDQKKSSAQSERFSAIKSLPLR